MNRIVKNPASLKRKNRKNITLGMKLEIIRRLEQGQSNSSICHEYSLPSSTVSTIRSKKEQIKAFCKNTAVQNQYYQISYPRNNIIEEVEVALFKWIKDRNFQVETIRYNEARDKALKFFDEAKKKLTEKGQEEKIDFKASHGWFDRFRKRFSKNISYNITNGNDKSFNETEDESNNIVMDIRANSPISDQRLPHFVEPITVIEEENENANEQIMTKKNFENDIMELFWGKVVSSIFSNEKVHNPNGNSLDAKSLAIVFKLSEAIINILESRDSEKKRFLGFKQNLAHILHPYREIYNQELSLIKDSLKNIYSN